MAGGGVSGEGRGWAGGLCVTGAGLTGGGRQIKGVVARPSQMRGRPGRAPDRHGAMSPLVS